MSAIAFFVFALCLATCCCYRNRRQPLPVRLDGGTQPWNGRVQVFVYYKNKKSDTPVQKVNGEWGGVCENGWTKKNADVVCRQLGYTNGAILFTTGDFYGRQRMRRIWLDKVRCDGREYKIGQCSHKPLGRIRCSTIRLAGVMCRPNMEDLLKQPPFPDMSKDQNIKFEITPGVYGPSDVISEGLLRVKNGGDKWGSVCADGWNMKDAEVACGQLGFPYADMKTPVKTYPQSRRRRRYKFFLTNLECDGTEASLFACKSPGIGSHSCRSRKPVMLKCSTSKPEMTPANKAGVTSTNRYANWTTVCDQNMERATANVMCRSLGYGTAEKYTLDRKALPESSKAIHKIKCDGQQWHVEKCNPKINSGKCKPYKDISVKCNIPTSRKRVYQIKLLRLKLDSDQSGDIISEGLLSVQYANGEWGSVCNDGWDENAAKVACGQLGFPYAEMYSTIKSHSQANWKYRFLLANVKCHGAEASLFSCQSSGIGSHSCASGQPVMLKCSALKSQVLRVRLKGGQHPSEGRVEGIAPKPSAKWGTICDKNMDITTANLICRSLGYGTAYEYTLGSVFPQGTTQTIYEGVKCDRNHPYLDTCKWTPIKWYSSCKHFNDAGVKCNVPQSIRKKKFQIRLSGSGRLNYLGRVEVNIGGKWGIICGDQWTMRNAMVVCRELGLGYATTNYSHPHYGKDGERLLNGITCFGNESSLDQCLRHSNMRNCSSIKSVAGVRCRNEVPDLVWDVKELAKTLQVRTFSLRSLYCAYDENCLTSSADADMEAGRDSKQRPLLRFSAKVNNVGTAAYRPYQAKSSWEWHSCHQHFHSDEEFALYDLIDMYTHTKVATGHKASYCLEDTECDKGVEKFYNCTGKGDQGISVNCHDNYDYTLDCQWVDLTDVTRFNTWFMIRLVANPSLKVGESDFTNNVALCKIYLEKYPGKSVDIRPRPRCWLEACENGVRSHRGNGNFACCKFPFVYLGKLRHTCVEDTKSQQFWCSTTENYDKDQLWGYC